MSPSARATGNVAQRRRRRRRTTDYRIVREIHRLRLLGRTGGDIERELSLDPVLSGLSLPARRTIDDIAAEVTPRDPSGAWSLSDPGADPDDAALVLPVLAEVMRASEWRVRGFTNEEAAWIARVRRVAPNIPALEAYGFARRYIGRAGAAAADVDRALALEVWAMDAQEVDQLLDVIERRYQEEDANA